MTIEIIIRDSEGGPEYRWSGGESVAVYERVETLEGFCYQDGTRNPSSNGAREMRVGSWDMTSEPHTLAKHARDGSPRSSLPVTDRHREALGRVVARMVEHLRGVWPRQNAVKRGA